MRHACEPPKVAFQEFETCWKCGDCKRKWKITPEESLQVRRTMWPEDEEWQYEPCEKIIIWTIKSPGVKVFTTKTADILFWSD